MLWSSSLCPDLWPWKPKVTYHSTWFSYEIDSFSDHLWMWSHDSCLHGCHILPILSNSIHMPQIKWLYSFLWLNSMFLCVDTTTSDRHFNRFYISAILNSTFLNTGVKTSLWDTDFSCFGHILKIRLGESYNFL